MSNLTRPLKKKISITMDEDLYEQLKVLAEEDGRNVSNYINLTMRRHVRSLSRDNSVQIEAASEA